MMRRNIVFIGSIIFLSLVSFRSMPASAIHDCAAGWSFDQEISCVRSSAPDSIIPGLRRLQSSVYLDFEPDQSVLLMFEATDQQAMQAGGSRGNLFFAYMSTPEGEWELLPTNFGNKSLKISTEIDQPGFYTILYPILPETGFPPGESDFEQSELWSVQPHKSGDDWIEIPSLSLATRIRSVNLTENGWEIKNLGDDAGWLFGSTYPGYQGNTVITGHYWNEDDSPGIFFNVSVLKYGDILYLSTHGRLMEYQVRSNEIVSRWNHSVFEILEEDWITLLTCEEYDPVSGEYLYRRVVRAVLVATY